MVSGVVLGLALLVTAMSYRASGLRAYQQAVSARQALGRPGTLDDLLATLPPINQEAQEKWDRWSKACVAAWREPAYDGKAWAAWVGGQGEVPASIATTCASREPLMQPACDLLDGGEVLLSALGWASIDLPPGKRGFEQVSRLRIPNLLATRDLAEWLRHTAGLGDEPQPALRRLDALQRNLSLKPGTLIDTMIAISMTTIRDRTYVELALRGTLADHDYARWRAEPSQALAWVADGFEGEAAIFVAGIATSLSGAASLHLTLSPWTGSNENIVHRAHIWLTGLHDCAKLTAIDGWIANRARGLRGDAPPSWAVLKPQLGPLARISLHNTLESLIPALQADANQRMARAAVHLIRTARTTGLPADQAAVGLSDLFTPTGDHLWIRYERLSDARFRLVVDPASPIPNFDDPARMKGRTKNAGTPANTAPLIYENGIELSVTPLP